MAVPTNGAGMDAGARMTQPGAGSGARPADPQVAANDALRARLDPSNPRYVGPGYAAFPGANGQLELRLTDPEAQNAWKMANPNGVNGAPAKPAIPTVADLNMAVQPATAPPAPLTTAQRLSQAAPMSTAGFTPLGAPRPAMTVAAPQMAPNLMPVVNMGAGGPAAVGGATSANPEANGPAEVDRAKIDALLGNVSKATSGLFGIAQNDAQFSAAQAQLAQGLAQGQANALSIARSGNRRDAAGLGARALQTNAEMSGEASRSAALLRAQEEDANRRLKLDAYKTAGDLGLNTAALEVDVNNLNMQAATSYLNNLFETNRLNLQLDEAEASRVTNFVRDMSLVAKDYYALDVAERQSFRDDLTRRYGISEGTKAAMAQLDAQPGFWEQAALGLVSGAGQGGTAALTTFALSDERMKTDVQDTTEAELDELLTRFPSKTYTYTGKRSEKGTQFGGMAQDLKRSRLGAGMVDSTSDGTLVVDGGKAGMAALSGLSKVWSKLKELEQAL